MLNIILKSYNFTHIYNYNFIIYLNISLEFCYIIFYLNSEIYNFIYIHNHYKLQML